MASCVDQSAPRSTRDLVGNRRQITALQTYFAKYRDPKYQHKFVFIYGPPGCGKTTCARLCAIEAKYSPAEINASSSRSSTSLREYVQPLMTVRNPIFSRPNAVICDEVDGMDATTDRGALATLSSMLKKHQCEKPCTPFVMIANEYTKNLRQMLRPFGPKCLLLSFDAISDSDIKNYITKIGVQPQEQLITASHGDMRKAITSHFTWMGAPQEFLASVRDMMTLDQSVDSATEAFRKLVNPIGLSLETRLDQYFFDPFNMPTIVQENVFGAWDTRPGRPYSYVSALWPPSWFTGSKSTALLDRMCDIADSMSDGDLVDAAIRGRQHFELQPIHGILSCVRPCHQVRRLHGGGGARHVLEEGIFLQDTFRLMQCITQRQANFRHLQLCVREGFHSCDNYMQYLGLASALQRNEFEHLAGNLSAIVQYLQERGWDKQILEAIFHTAVLRDTTPASPMPWLHRVTIDAKFLSQIEKALEPKKHVRETTKAAPLEAKVQRDLFDWNAKRRKVT